MILTHRPPPMRFRSSQFLMHLAKPHYPLTSMRSFPLSSLHMPPPSPHLHQQPILDESLVLNQLSHLFPTPTPKREKTHRRVFTHRRQTAQSPPLEAKSLGRNPKCRVHATTIKIHAVATFTSPLWIRILVRAITSARESVSHDTVEPRSCDFRNRRSGVRENEGPTV